MPVPEFSSPRRTLLLGASAAVLGQIVGCGGGSGPGGETSASAPDPSRDPPTTGNAIALPIIPLDEGFVDAAGTRVFSLRIQSGTTSFGAGVAARTLGYNGSLLGPALHLRKGETTRVEVVNDVPEVTSVHWHGLFVPADVDGGPHQPIGPGERWTPSFRVANASSTCWFHPHIHGTTGRQVVQGLAGLLVVDDDFSAKAGLPGRWGTDDLALVLQDKRFDAAGAIDYALTAQDRQNGYLGDTLLVNGAIAPVWQAPAQWVRLRLLNGCNARLMSIRVGDGMPLLQVAHEGGLLAAPVSRSAIQLAPGQRAEVLVDLSAVDANQSVPMYAATVGSSFGMMGAGVSEEVVAMTLRVSQPRQAGAMVQPPITLPGSPAMVAPAGAVARTFRLGGGMMGMSAFTINGASFDSARVDVRIPAGTTEVWEFVNATMMAHPMHVHGVLMSILDVNGAPPPDHERGLRDTVIVGAMQTVRLAVRTADTASSTPLMYHCHILEHEDAGMMGQFITY